MTQFAKMPVAVFADSRLGLRHIKVLGAILSFADAEGKCHPKRSQITDRCGIREKDVTVITAQLCSLGWLEKTGNGGRSSAMDYVVKTSPVFREVNTQKNLPGITAKTSPVFREVNTQKNLPGITAKTSPEYGEVSKKETSPEYGLNLPGITAKTSPEYGEAPSRESGEGIQQTISTDQQQTNNRPVAAPLKTHPVAGKENSSVSAAKKTRLTPEMSEACKRTWDSYAVAYSNRYGADPVKNAKTAGQVVQFVRRIGMTDAPHVAAHYLTSSARWYVTVGHSTDAMLKDAEKLRMEWATNRRITSESARQADVTQSNFSAAEQAKALIARRAVS